MKPEAVAELIIGVVEVYLALGLAFALPCALFLVGRLDPSAREATWGFRALVIPGLTLLWPWMLGRLIRGRGVPVECSAHRVCAARRIAAVDTGEDGS